MKKSRAEAARGSAMVIALCLLLGLLIFSVGFLLRPWQEYLLSHRTYQGMAAFNLAEAGVEYTCWAIGSGGNIASWAGTSPRTRTETGFATYAGETKGDFSIKAWPTPQTPKDVWLVESTGYVPSAGAAGAVSRSVKVLCVPKVVRPFSGALLGDSVVTVGGAVEVDSYDSRIGAYGDESLPYSNIHRGGPGDPDEGKGDIATNSGADPAIDLGNNITVYGDLMTGEGGTVSPADFDPSGETTHDFSEELPYKTAPTDVTYVVQPGDGVLSLKDNYSYPAGNYKFTKIDLSGNGDLTFNGPSVVWVTGFKGLAISETGSSVIRCNGKVEFYVEAPVSLTGNGFTNASMLPTDCAIYGGQGCTDIYGGGSNAFYGLVYAPNASVRLAGSEDKYGAFVGKTITVQGGSNFHYDEALGDLALQGGKYTLRSWQEK